MLRRPALLFAATTVAAGIVAAYLPLAASGPAVALGLFVQALAATRAATARAASATGTATRGWSGPARR
jgi:hypothetical protein